MKLLTTFQRKCAKSITGRRVKGISFHPYRPWVLTSLHNGVIELYDYRLKMLIDKYEEHDGAVRSVCFHKTQPLFVSGGDDYKVKVWNYQLKKCLFTLEGHGDYIRTVQFHDEHPWIVSASDDQTIRIWNWQNRTCMTTITGHHHYVMCAKFHPTEDLLVSCSLDQEIRVWDISSLRTQKYQSKPDFFNVSKFNKEIFGNNDVQVKFILTGHERGVNWVSFHPTSKYIVSSADDKEVKLWRYKDDEGWEVESFSGHSHNVSCAIFHPNKDMIISNSEDKCMKFWSLSKGTYIDSYELSDDRFWILALHPSQNLICAGHDHGFMVFKLAKERPAFYVDREYLYFCVEDTLKKYSFKDGSESNVGGFYYSTKHPIVEMTNSPKDRALIVCRNENGKRTNDYFVLPSDKSSDIISKHYTGLGKYCVFTGSGRFSFLESSDKIIVRKVNEPKRTKFDPVNSIGYAQAIFGAKSGSIYIQTLTRFYLFDIEENVFLNDIEVAKARVVVWSDDKSRIAIITKTSITICDPNLKIFCSVKETGKIKGGVFDGKDVFIYSTQSHLKYLLSNGDKGILKTIKTPIYLAKVKGKELFFLTRNGTVRKTPIDSTEYKFKLALMKNNGRQIYKVISKAKLLGDSIISYLYKKGFPKIAMKFVKDDTTRFNLAIECGDIETAKKAAFKLDTPKCWNILATEAIKQGDHSIVEKSYERVKNFEKLSFLYFITGQEDKLKKMSQFAHQRKDIMSKFHNSLLTGDIVERIKILIEAGQFGMAYVSAVLHGKTELAEKIKPNLDKDFEMPKDLPKPQLMTPPKPLLVQQNWPRLFSGDDVDKEKFMDDFEDDGDDDDDNDDNDGSSWNNDLDIIPKKEGENFDGEKRGEIDDGDDGDDMWGGGIEVNKEDIKKVLIEEDDSAYVAPSIETPLDSYWKTNSKHHTDLIACGSFKLAMKKMKKKFGIINFVPLKQHFMDIYISKSVRMPVVFDMPNVPVYLERTRDGKNREKDKSLPNVVVYSQSDLMEIFDKTGSKEISKGKFEAALLTFRKILYSSLFSALKRGDEKKINEIQALCTEYLTGINMEKERKSLGKEDIKRNLELSAYFTRCKIKLKHLKLTVFQAMSLCHKARNYLTADSFAERLLEMSPSKRFNDQAKYVRKFAQSHQSNEIKLDYDARNPFVICTQSNSPIYAGSESISCPFCEAHSLPKFKGERCKICELCNMGDKKGEDDFF